MAQSTWVALERDYEAPALRREQTADHPLLAQSKSAVVMESRAVGGRAQAEAPAAAPAEEQKGGEAVADDPLSMMLAEEDPLSMMAAQAAAATPAAPERHEAHVAEAREAAEDAFEADLNTPWNTFKQQILREYTVSGSIRVTASFLNQQDNTEEAQTRSLGVESARARLEQLQDPADGNTMEMSQKEYTDHIERLHEGLQTAWANEERVLSLKLAIQVAKLLADTNVPAFYPSMFVLITEILDTFGRLVYERLKSKAVPEGADHAVHTGGALPEDWTHEDVGAEAKETCRNWLYKCACIRELNPRLLIECALLPCYRFLSSAAEYPAILARLTSMARGIGDPLVAVYVRAYIARVGMTVLPESASREYVMSGFYDYLYTFREFREQKIASYLDKFELTEGEYLNLHSPAVEWLLKCVGQQATRQVFTTALQHYRDYCSSSMVLRHVIDSFSPQFYAANSLAMAALCKQALPSAFSTTDLYQSLGRQLVHTPPPADQRLPLLNEVWKTVARCQDLKSYVGCVSAWLELLLLHYSEREVLILLKDLCRHLDQAASENADMAPVIPQLEQVMTVLVDHNGDFGDGVLTSEYFIKIMDVFKSDRKTEMCKNLLDTFVKNQPPTNDAIIIHTVFDIARHLHDSVDSLSSSGETRHVSALICGFIDKIEFGQDLEAQLNVYVDCRNAFSNLDAVMERLVTAVAALAMKAHGYMKGRHTKKTSAFVKACLAYAHITTPSIASYMRRLNLLLLCGEVALVNQCLPQTDTFVKAAISLIPDVPDYEEVDGRREATEARLLAYVEQFVSALIVVPGHPEHGPLYLVRGLINALDRYAWQEDSGRKTQAFVGLVPLLTAYAQRRLPYSVDRVESNDSLYGGSAAYLDECKAFLNEVVGIVMAQLAELQQAGHTDKITPLVLRLVNLAVANVDLADAATTQLVKRFLDLADRHKTSATASYYANTVAAIRARGLAGGKNASGCLALVA